MIRVEESGSKKEQGGNTEIQFHVSVGGAERSTDASITYKNTDLVVAIRQGKEAVQGTYKYAIQKGLSACVSKPSAILN